jgi:aromatic-L-amino-acid decarboxylase
VSQASDDAPPDRRHSAAASPTLDPADWKSFRAEAHRMLDDAIDYVEGIRGRPVWQPMPDAVRAGFRQSLPTEPTPLGEVHAEFMRTILPFATGNTHPGFMGWVHGGGNPVGMMGELLAAALNANLGGRDHAPIEIERQIAQWMRQVFGFPETANGLFLTGSSMANFVAILAARAACGGNAVRRGGVVEAPRLTAYTSTAAHGCIARGMDFAGLGSDQLRRIATDADYRLDPAALACAVEADRRQGRTPFLVVATAGSVDTGAIDDLAALAAFCRSERLWLHIDGAFGALAMLAPDLAPLLHGIEAADSIAFDFHKWGQVPYDSGFILARDGQRLLAAFEAPAAYLSRATRGLAAGSPWPCDLGPDLSRGFRALKTWFTLKVHGTAAIGATISESCALARHLAQRARATPELELLAAGPLNIVCFRYRAPDADADADALNARIAIELQESGIVAPSTTRIGGHLALRAAIVNHRTRRRDVDALIEKTLEFGRLAAADTSLRRTA